MTVQDYLRVLREQWAIVVAVTLLAVAVAGGAWSVRPLEYSATLTMYVSAQATETANAAYQGSLLSEQRVTSYVKLLESTRVSRAVISDLNVPGTPEAVAGQISASAAPDSVLIDVAVTDRSPTTAAALANSVGSVFTRLVEQLERPAEPGAVAPVIIRVVEPATVPTAPSSAGLTQFLMLGLLIGLAGGLGLALVRNTLDTSVKTLDQLKSATGAPNLATIAYDQKVPRRPLILHEDAQSPRAEAFRQLRTNLQYVDLDQPHKVILVSSTVSGEGKTTTVCNLAITLAAAGRRVLVVEGDLRRPALAALLGLDGAAGLTDVLVGRLQPHQVIQQWAGGDFDVLASGPLPPNPSELLGSHQMAALLRDLRARYDVILVDSPPLLPVTDAAAMAPATDGVIMICRFHKTSRVHLGRGVDALSAVSVRLLGTVLTMTPKIGRGDYASYAAYRSTERRPPAVTTVDGPKTPLARTGSSGFGRVADPPPVRRPDGRE